MRTLEDLIVGAKRDGWASTFLSPGVWSLLTYRFGRFIYLSRGRRSNPAWYFYLLLVSVVRIITKIELPETASIGRRLYLPHPHGLVVGRSTVIGDDCTLGPWVVLGHNGRCSEMPTLEDGVYVGPKATILGPVRVGAGAVVAAGALVTRDVPPHMLAGGNPPRTIEPLGLVHIAPPGGE